MTVNDPGFFYHSAYFNSHARVGRDRFVLVLGLVLLHFNSHARVGRDLSHQHQDHGLYDFNSHARVGRDMSNTTPVSRRVISTHTPV